MNVRLEIHFDSPTDEDMASMRSVATRMTTDRKSIRLAARADDARRLVAEFTMATEPQYLAVEKIDGELRFWVTNRVDSTIMFPKTEQERLRAKRKAERRRAARQRAQEP